jgi:hypothetical protein
MDGLLYQCSFISIYRKGQVSVILLFILKALDTRYITNCKSTVIAKSQNLHISIELRIKVVG